MSGKMKTLRTPCKLIIGETTYELKESTVISILVEAYWSYRMAMCQYNIQNKDVPEKILKRKRLVEAILEKEGQLSKVNYPVEKDNDD